MRSLLLCQHENNVDKHMAWKDPGSDIKSGDDQNAGSCNTGYTSENMDI